MSKLGLVVAAALGGAAVYWYIKRTCPCQHEAAAASSAPATAARPVASDDKDAYDANASTAGTGGGSSFTGGAEFDAGATSSSSAALDPGCTSCGAAPPPAALTDVGFASFAAPQTRFSSTFATVLS